ncbi:MAG: hypothetical protein KatS3mg031_2197 [Chitinophagales bacterium]|nr:MAG: hypothetical protein KatS3mg031_2197 [Chitinophagales bacterium]
MTEILDILIPLILLMVIFFFILRALKVLKKRVCPACSGKLTRKPRTPLDKLVTAMTFNILPFRRYKCIHCGWEGLRWSNRKYKTGTY